MHSLIILAAGSGSRMKLGYNKMLHEVDGDIILNHTIKQFIGYKEFKELIIVINPTDEKVIQQKIIKDERIKLVYGAGERQDSVACGVEHASGEYIFVHDGARMYISDELIQKILQKITGGADAYVCAVKVKDSIRKVQNNVIVEVLERDELYAMQTPQIVKKNILKQIEQQAKIDKVLETDEVGLLNHYAYQVEIIDGEYSNKKVTTIEDL